LVRPHTENWLHEDGKNNSIRMEKMERLQTGRPGIRWLDDVCDDMKVMNVRNLKELAHYR